MKNLELMLAKHPFLHGLSDEYIREIAGHAMIFKFDEGDILFDEGEPANKFYLIIKGKVAITTFAPNKGITIQTVEDGEMLGWSWLVAPYKYKFNARVLTRTEFIAINGVELRNQCEKDPGLGYELLRRMVQAIAFRLEQTRLLVLDIYGNRSK
ncbi:MAG TPA: cyclic nucleotide-binding domain-containing protein [Mucilaginibacter sp.]|jgi:CRP-like cAMP-binding protein